MITGPKYKVCRRLGEGVYEKCQLPAFQVRKNRGHQNLPKKHRSGQRSDYANALIEKQKVRFGYGITERQLGNYVKSARKLGGNTAENLYRLLEARLDNVVYRSGLAKTRRLARQLVSHGHITVNGRRVNIPSRHIKEGEVVAVRPESKNKGAFSLVKEKKEEARLPVWLSFDLETFSANINGAPVFDPGAEGANFSTVIGFYSRV